MEKTIWMKDGLGYVRYDEHLGSDQKIAEIAGISREKVPEPELCRKLFEWTPKHESPFEQAVVRFKIKMPIFVLRQMVRHRTHSMMEKSMRYCNAEDVDFFVPETFRDEKGVILSDSNERSYSYEEAISTSLGSYQDLLQLGVAKEQARMVLPVCTYTEFYWLQNLRNIFHLLYLRTDRHAQKEIRDYANAIAEIVKELYPISFQAWEDYCKLK
jgi:thymidylate synthase (FAD)